MLYMADILGELVETMLAIPNSIYTATPYITSTAYAYPEIDYSI